MHLHTPVNHQARFVALLDSLLPLGRKAGPVLKAGFGLQLIIGLFLLGLALSVSFSAEAAGNKPPKVVIAKPVPVNEGAAVTLDASLTSDPEGGALSYAWVQTKGSPAIALSGANTNQLSFTAPAIQKSSKPTKPVSFTFQLTATDTQGASAAKTVVLTVKPLNTPPVANAGADSSAGLGQNVTLTSASTDPDASRGGQIVKYEWKQLVKPGDPKVKLLNAKTPAASFTSPAQPAQLQFQLTVTDNDKAKASDTVNVTVADVQPLTATFTLDKQAIAPGATVVAGVTGIQGGLGPYKVRFDWGEGQVEEVPLGNGETAKTASHQYASAGNFTQKVIVIDAGNNQKASTPKTITVAVPALNATLSVNPATLQTGAQLTAQAVSISGGTGAYTVKFDWGDNTPSLQETLGNGVSAKSANHAYAAAGTYTLAITVTDAGNGIKTQSFTITVNQPQVAELSGVLTLTQAEVVFNTPVEAKISISGGVPPYSVKFEWGDGSLDGPAQLANAVTNTSSQHFYGLVGTYQITATITDSANHTKIYTTSATVKEGVAPLACQ